MFKSHTLVQWTPPKGQGEACVVLYLGLHPDGERAKIQLPIHRRKTHEGKAIADDGIRFVFTNLLTPLNMTEYL